MGTRADFYVGRGKDAEWIGSIAWDGYDIGQKIPKAKTEKTYRKLVAEFLASRDDATLPKDGWPWPWNDSGTTDCAYAFDGGKVYQEGNGYWWTAKRNVPKRAYDKPKGVIEWPDMSEKQNVQFGGVKSGLIVISAAQ